MKSVTGVPSLLGCSVSIVTEKYAVVFSLDLFSLLRLSSKINQAAVPGLTLVCAGADHGHL